MPARSCGARALRSPLETWWARAPADGRLDARTGPTVFLPRDTAWRQLAPGFAAVVALVAGAGLPFQIAHARRYDRAGDPRRLAPALRAGHTVYCPQIHQALPRVARLMVALRSLLGHGRDERSFLFAVEGRGQEAFGLHHDGAVASVWVQLEGRRTVTLGPRVRRGTPADLDRRRVRGPGWTTRDLEPGTLLWLPPWTPHAVVCRGRSLALSLTWGRRAVAARGAPEWDVVSGRALELPRPARGRLWCQIPVRPGRVGRGARTFRLTAPEGTLTLPASARPLAASLATMPSVLPARLGARARRAADTLLAHGILAPVELPLAIRPDDPRALDGWSFA